MFFLCRITVTVSLMQTYAVLPSFVSMDIHCITVPLPAHADEVKKCALK